MVSKSCLQLELQGTAENTDPNLSTRENALSSNIRAIVPEGKKQRSAKCSTKAQ